MSDDILDAILVRLGVGGDVVVARHKIRGGRG